MIDNQAGITVKNIDLLERVLRITTPWEPDTPVSFTHEMKIEIKVSLEQNEVIAILAVSTLKDKEEMVGSMKVAITYGFEKMTQYFNEKGEGQEGILEIFERITDLSIATMRGIMFGEFRGTPLHSALLPIFDAESFRFSKNPDTQLLKGT